MDWERKERSKSPINVRPLHLGFSMESLEKLVKQDETIKAIKNVHKLPSIVNKLKRQIFNQLDDQEKCFLLCKRYIHMVEFMQKTHEDQNFIQAMFSYDSDQIEKLITDLTKDLTQRYLAQNEQYGYIDCSSDDSKNGSKEVDTARHTYIKPTTTAPAPELHMSRSEDPGPSGSRQVIIKSKKVFRDWFIKPVELFHALIGDTNLMIVDIRRKADFQESHIIVDGRGSIINIPSKLIMPGLSANTLGKKLDRETQFIWQKRDTFEAIILLDDHTMKYDYQGSKLAQLRNLIVEWDLNKKYEQEPVILNGGLKEFVEWYPSEITNTNLYLLHNHNAEIDELLDLDSISYPEPGTSTGPLNVKMYSINSGGHLEYRVNRDFGPPGKQLGSDHILSSISEGHLPIDAYETREIIPGPFESVSEIFIHEPPEETSEEHEVISKKTKLHSEEDEFCPKKPRLFDDGETDIQGVIEGKRASLLKEARALKPKPQHIDTMIFEAKKQDPPLENVGVRVDDVEMKLPKWKTSTKKVMGEQTVKTKPVVDRSHKPFTQPEPVQYLGEGFTSLKNFRNICYINTMMQCLKVIPVLKAVYVTSNLYIKYTRKRPAKLNLEFGTALKELWGGSRRNPKSYYLKDLKGKIVILNPIYDKGNHEDTFEFFLFLFTHLSEDCEYEIPRPSVCTETQRAWIGHLSGRSSFLIDLFFYQIRNRRICRQCNKVNLSFEVDNTLMLPLPDHLCTLQELIYEYLKETTIADFACIKCKTIGSLVHYKDIVSTPDVLVIVLKRHKVSMDGYVSKNEVGVNFPKDNLKFGNATYKLYAVPQHVGTTSCGHYYSTVLLDDKKDDWYVFNDDEILTCEPNINEKVDVKINSVGFFYVKHSGCDKS